MAQVLAPAAPVASPAAGGSERLLSLDALRGFDMFWIVGAESIVHALDKLGHFAVVRVLGRQLDHKAWEGFAFYDLIFPLFVFMVGVSIVFSMSKLRERGGQAQALRRIVTRGLLMYVIGVLYYGGIARGWEGLRMVGVLQRIAFAYVGASLLFSTVRTRGLVVAFVILLVGYWALLTFVPIRDIAVDRSTTLPAFHATRAWVTGKYGPGLNLTNHIDFQYLPGRRWDGAYDPEGLLSNLPAVASCLAGVFAGLWLRRRDVGGQRKALVLAAVGLAAVLLGFLWGLQFPVVKKLWTSSFVLVAGGYSCLLLAAFYQVIEVWNRRRWTLPFVWIGMNPITIYLLDNVVDFRALAARFVGGPVKAAMGPFGDLLVAAVALALTFAVVQFLYQRRIFLRL